MSAENIASEIGFTWWNVWAWLGLIVGNLSVMGSLNDQMDVALTIVLINTVMMVLILKMNKYAFLVATIVSFNPILWIINGIYLKNRWNHPIVNKGTKAE